MIARSSSPCPAPIPFDTSDSPGGEDGRTPTATRAISWSSASGLGVHVLLTPASKHQGLYSSQTQAFLARRSPVKVAEPSPAATYAARAQTSSARPASAAVARPKPAPVSTAPVGELTARYIGHGALSVRSSVTGRLYRFTGHGDSQQVDKHDLVLLRRIGDIQIR